MSQLPVIVSFYTRDTPYEAAAAKLRASADAFGYETDIASVPSCGDWARNCAQKAVVIRHAIATHGRRPLIFLDADCTIRRPLELLHDPDCDFSIHSSGPERITVGMYALRHRRFAARMGGMWNSGVFFLRPTEALCEAVEDWVALCEQHPEEWDQIHLQRAVMAQGERVRLAALLPDYRAGRRFIAHTYAHHAVWAEPHRWLLLGSAPYVKDWWAANGQRFVDAGFIIAAMNNAWRVPGEALHSWFRPDDFVGPSPQEPWICDNFRGWKVAPYWIQGFRSSTIDAMHHLLNSLAANGSHEFELHVAGSDFIYPTSGSTHFYGRGQRDPLRYGEEPLLEALQQTAENFAAAGAKVFNAGWQVETLLPFERSPMVTMATEVHAEALT